MQKIIKVVGLTFRDLSDFKKTDGKVELTKEEDNKFDSKAIAVYIDDQFVGYVPKGADQNWIHENFDVVKTELDKILYKGTRVYTDKDGKKVFKNDFNEDGNGEVCSIQIKVSDTNEATEFKFKDYTITYDDVAHEYFVNGEKKESATRFLKEVPVGDPKRLILWAMNCVVQGKFMTTQGYEEYMGQLAQDGTELHLKCELFLNGHKEPNIAGFKPMQNFVKEFDIKNALTEQAGMYYDKDLDVCGTPDLIADTKKGKACFDFKSGKGNDKHKMQVAMGAHAHGCKVGYIISFRTLNKKGYAAETVDVERYYKKAKAWKVYKEI